MAYAAYAASFAHQKLKTVVISHLASPVTTQCCCCHFAPTFSQRFFAENPKRAHRVWKHLSNFCPGSRSRERPDTVCGKRQLIFSARRISHLQNLCATCGLWMSAAMAHVTLAAKRLDLTSAPVLICTGINSFSRILALNGEPEKQTLRDSQTCVVCPWLYLKIHPTHPLWSLNWTQKQDNDPPRAPTLPRATWHRLMVKAMLLLHLDHWNFWLLFIGRVVGKLSGCARPLALASLRGLPSTSKNASKDSDIPRFRNRFWALWKLQFSADFWFHSADPIQSKPQSSSNSVVIWTMKHRLGFGVTSNFRQLSDLRAVAIACSFTHCWQDCGCDFSRMSWSRHFCSTRDQTARGERQLVSDVTRETHLYRLYPGVPSPPRCCKRSVASVASAAQVASNALKQALASREAAKPSTAFCVPMAAGLIAPAVWGPKNKTAPFWALVSIDHLVSGWKFGPLQTGFGASWQLHRKHRLLLW